jgi:hypothetical protein
LIANYGFVFASNDHDSYYVNLCMDINLKNPSVKTMVEFDDSDRTAVQARLKRDQLNEVLLGYLRTMLKGVFFDNAKGSKDLDKMMSASSKKILLTRPKNLFFERFIMKTY